MSQLKYYNNLTDEWGPAIVGAQGASGLTGSTGPQGATGFRNPQHSINIKRFS